VGFRHFGGEFAVDVVSIGTQFLSTVGESEGKRTSGEIPCRKPFVGRANVTFHVRDSKTDFCVSNASLPLFINCSVVER